MSFFLKTSLFLLPITFCTYLISKQNKKNQTYGVTETWYDPANAINKHTTGILALVRPDPTHIHYEKRGILYKIRIRNELNGETESIKCSVCEVCIEEKKNISEGRPYSTKKYRL